MSDEFELYPDLADLPLHKNGRSGPLDRDQADLLRLGKKPILKVRRSYARQLIMGLKLASSEILDSCRCWASVAPSS